MTSEEQIEQWVAGNPIHNKDRDECCPDFSCCKPELLAEEHERKVFQTADLVGDRKTRMSMLGTFLGRMLALVAPDKKVHIAEEEGRESVLH